MRLKEKMEEFGLTERKLPYNKDYSIEYFTFSRKSAINALCYLIDNAKDSIKIYHWPIDNDIYNNEVIKILCKSR